MTRVLLITSKPVYPVIDGGCMASEAFLKTLLHQNITVKLLSIATPKHPFLAEKQPPEIARKTQLETVYINTDVTLVKAFFHLFKRGSYNVNRFHSQEMEAKIAQLIQTEAFSTIILDSLHTTSYLPFIRKHFRGMVMIRTHNVEGDIWKQYAKDATGIKKWYLRKLAHDISKAEYSVLNKADYILSITREDKKRFVHLGVRTPCTTIPVVVNVPAHMANYTNATPYHLGAMDWKPNIASVRELIEIYRELAPKITPTPLHIAGKESDTLPFGETENVYFDGFVDNIRQYAIEKGILCAPIRSGSGIRIKILEAMALGIPVLTTPLGASGINHQESNCLIVAEEKHQLREQLFALVTNEALRKEIGENAREYVRKNHTIEAVSTKLIELLERK